MFSSFRTGLVAIGLVVVPTQAMICGDTKTVHVQLPASWTQVYSYSTGLFTNMTLTSEGNSWYSFPLSGGESGRENDWFYLGKVSGGWTEPAIGSQSFGAINILSTTAERFTCSVFGSSSDLYIMEDPRNPGRTYSATTPPNSQVFHFFPPETAEWAMGLPELVVNGVAVPMKADVDACGWFTVTWFNQTLPDTARIWLAHDTAVYLEVALQARFASLGSNVYWIADYGGDGFFDSDLGITGSCQMISAALFYDTDASLHGAFSCDNYPSVGTSSCPFTGVTYYGQDGKVPCMGVTKGIVQPTLSAARKPVYVPASGCFESAAKFDQLFQVTPSVNNQLCVDIPYARNAAGRWEYDSYKTPDQGFFPLETQPNSGAGFKRSAYGDILLGNGSTTDGVADWGEVNPATGWRWFDQYNAQAGEFSSGTNPDVYNNNAWGACPNTSQPGQCRQYFATGRNQHFCMESHSTFVYRPGQQIAVASFGDLWLFLDNSLVVDLGGVHMAAPGFVNLDSLGLVAGASYPMDLFMCQRRTDMSSFRFESNIPFAGPRFYGLFYESTSNPDGSFSYAFATGYGSSTDCQVLQNGTHVPVPASDPSIELEYHLTVSYRDSNGTLVTDTLGELSVGNVWYGGIDLTVRGTVTIRKAALGGLVPNHYKLIVSWKGRPGAREIITFSVQEPEVNRITRHNAPPSSRFQVRSVASNGLVRLPASLEGEPVAIHASNGRLLYQGRAGREPVRLQGMRDGVVLVSRTVQ